MAQYEGLVASLTTDGKAEVVIRPGTPGIVGAPELTGRVCHCASDGSTVRIETLNGVGASPGDVVSVARASGRPMKNAALLLGVPLLGGISGVMAGLVLTSSFGAGVTAVVVTSAVGLLLGIIVGVSVYKRMSDKSQFMVTKIIRSRADIAALPAEGPSGLRGENVSCEGCDRRCI